MRELRLLERIARLEQTEERTRQTRAEILAASIIEHLRRILNTRQGSVPIDAQFGVPDFTNLAGSFVVGETGQIIKDINDMIIRYEPRLKQPRIELAEDDQDVLSLSFILEGQVRVNDHDIALRVATRVSSDGRVSLARR